MKKIALILLMHTIFFTGAVYAQNCNTVNWEMEYFSDRASSTWSVCPDKIQFSITATTSSFYFFYTNITIVQSGKQMTLSSYPSGDNEAKIHYDASSEIKQGVTVTGWIDKFPSWFDIFSPFRIYYSDDYIDVSGAVSVTTTTTTIQTGSTTTTTVSTTTTVTGNNKPYTPTNPYPSDGATNIPVSVMLSWDSGDPDGDPVTYDIYFGANNPPVLYKKDLTTNRCQLDNLEPSATYFWKIIAKDNQGGTSESTIWSFTTEAANSCPASQLLDDNKEDLDLLRQFRDEKLMKSSIGIVLVNVYYKYGADVSKVIQKNPTIKEQSSRFLKSKLMPIVKDYLDDKKEAVRDQNQ